MLSFAFPLEYFLVMVFKLLHSVLGISFFIYIYLSFDISDFSDVIPLGYSLWIFSLNLNLNYFCLYLAHLPTTAAPPQYNINFLGLIHGVRHKRQQRKQVEYELFLFCFQIILVKIIVRRIFLVHPINYCLHSYVGNIYISLLGSLIFNLYFLI